MEILKNSVPHLIAITIFFIVASLFFLPLYQGKTLVQSDNIQLKGTFSEVQEYRENENRIIKWSNKEFSGMPTLTGSATDPFYFAQTSLGKIFPQPVLILLFAFLSFYLLLAAFELKIWLRVLGGFAFAFSTFNIISIEAGHNNKVYAIAFMASILASLIWAYRGKLLFGFVTALVATGYQIYFGHIQISYYTIIVLGGYFVFQLYTKWKEGQLQSIIKPSIVLMIAGLLGVAMTVPKIWAIQEYSSYSNRGGSELAQEKSENTGGLDKEYAYRWSNGVLEVFTAAFPYFHGGASAEELGKNSATGKSLDQNRVDRNTARSILRNVPTYWGQQPGTAGPIYFGIIVVFLFISGYFFLDRKIMIWATVLCVLGFLLSMGKNLQWFSDIFFDYIPLYNKFRSVTMIMSIPELIFPLIGMLSLSAIVYGDKPNTEKFRKVLISASVLLGMGAFFFLFKSFFFDFQAPGDANLAQAGYPDWLISAIEDDRSRLFNQDIGRAFLFVGLSLGLIWLFLWKRVKLLPLIGVLSFLIFIDLWLVNKRYLGESDYSQTRRNVAALQPSIADNQINQDKSGYYRVFNLLANPTGDGITSYHHYSVGGYNAIKIQRYQDLIENHLTQVNRGILNMLNVRYFITNNGGSPVAQRNPGALGNAWLINELEWVDGANQEIEKVGIIDQSKKATIDSEYKEEFQKENFDGQGQVSLSSYDPEKMVYDFSSDSDQFVVFSEVWYGPGWIVKIDGQEMPHFRVNYVLRGMPVPSGEHRIEFQYAPNSYKVGESVAIVSSLLSLILIGAGIWLRKKGLEI